MGARRQRAWAPTPRFFFRDGGTAQQGRNSRSIFLHKKQRRQTLLAPQHFFVNKYEQGRKGEKSRTHSRFWVVAKTKLSSTNKKSRAIVRLMCTNASVPYNNFKKIGQNFRALPHCICALQAAQPHAKTVSPYSEVFVELRRCNPHFPAYSVCRVRPESSDSPFCFNFGFLCTFFRRISDCSAPVRSFSHFLF